MASQANKKHRHLTRSNCCEAGYTAPTPTKSKKGGKFPHLQSFKRVK